MNHCIEILRKEGSVAQKTEQAMQNPGAEAWFGKSHSQLSGQASVVL